jgi:site-specific DNA-cytosine methylase
VDTPVHRTQTVAELAAYFLALAPKTLWPYRTDSGRIAYKLGRVRLDHANRSGVLSGLETLHHPLTGWPLTPRERARLMNWPDSFHLNSPGRTSFSRSDIMRLVLFTGKAVPSGFPRFLIPQLIKHLRSKS